MNLNWWKYRVKIYEKIYYVFIMIFAAISYKSPSLNKTIFKENSQVTVPCFFATVIIFYFLDWYIEHQCKKEEKHLSQVKRVHIDVKT